MLAKTISDYGGVHVDADTVNNPQSQIAAGTFDRLAEDAAQMTISSDRAKVYFDTSAVAAPFNYAASAVTHKSQWGSGSAQQPTVRKLATGRYRITYATSFTDALSVVENVVFTGAGITVGSSNTTDDIYARHTTIASNVVELVVESPKGTLADVGNVSAAVLSVRATLD